MENQKLFIGNLNYEVTEHELRELIAPFGTVMQLKVFTGKGYAFAEMIDEKDAEAVIANLDKKEFHGREMHVSIRLTKKKAAVAAGRRFEAKGRTFKKHREPREDAPFKREPRGAGSRRPTHHAHHDEFEHDDSQRHFIDIDSEKVYRDPSERPPARSAQGGRGFGRPRHGDSRGRYERGQGEHGRRERTFRSRDEGQGQSRGGRRGEVDGNRADGNYASSKPRGQYGTPAARRFGGRSGEVDGNRHQDDSPRTQGGKRLWRPRTTEGGAPDRERSPRGDQPRRGAGRAEAGKHSFDRDARGGKGHKPTKSTQARKFIADKSSGGRRKHDR